MQLSRHQIKSMSGNAIFSRGEQYYRLRRVHSLTWEGDSVRADVLGSRKRPYTVTALQRHGELTVKCTCPYDWGGLCKHGVAVLLYLLDHGGSSTQKGLRARAGFRTPRVGRLSSQREGQGIVEKDPALEAFLLSGDDPIRLQVGISVKGLENITGKGVSFSLFIQHGGQTVKVSDLDAFIAPERLILHNHLPYFTALSQGQQHLLHMLRGFVGESSAYGSVQLRRMMPFQLSMLLEHVCRQNDIEIVEIKTREPLRLLLDPPIGLRVVVRSARKNQIAVAASLIDPLHPAGQGSMGQVFFGSRSWLFDAEHRTFRLMHPRIEQRFLKYFHLSERVLDARERQHFLAGILPKLKEFAEVVMDDPQAYTVRVERPAPRPCYEVDVIKGELEVALSFDYGGQRISYAQGGSQPYWEYGPEDDRRMIRRDIPRENEIAGLLVRNYTCVFSERSKRFYVTRTDEIFDFLSSHVHALQKDGDVFLSQRAKALYQEGEVIRPCVRVSSSGMDWFAYDIAFRRGGGELDIPMNVVKDHLDNGWKFVRLKTGEFIPLDQGAFARVADLLEDRERQGRLMLAHIPFVMEGLREEGVEVELDPQTRGLYDDLRSFNGLEPVALPPFLSGVLRDYQGHGVNWLAFLKKFRFGGILADEMGLGKTLQALTVILKDIEAGCALPSLVVCPTTLVWNWEAEIKKFLPATRTLVISNKDRIALMEQIPKAQIVITSYALLRRDIEKYHAHRFHFLILDEAQNIKNRHTISARVVKQLNAAHRLALTGTPLENSIADIWSLFDFLMPSFLGNYERFRASYEIPITQFRDEGKLKELSRRIAPFVLRRLKKDVIKELPDRIEQTAFCELEPTQAKIYAAMAEKARAQALEAYRAKGFNKSRMLILTLLLRLRQICCHPELAGVRLKHRIGVSAKMDLLKEMLNELLSSGHKVLVFSQFVDMLKIMRDHLEKEKVSFEYMDGKTKKRQCAVERFNADPQIKVFLLSLKVGGLGLNLTSADTVILYEPWWNPAVEQQAIDRTHRIGQKSTVLAYHLIARGTIEEKIQALQQRKKFLMNALVLSEETMAKKLGWEDIRFLLDIKD
ncbi:MAG TPA: hypothetical protein DD723_00275 [Candidatus Omnitrophica bacterium]|nr:MAG: hypothetical protein A2Z81_04550 [Omnitrophica WOR_2 bacterium GWA2_45_18]HBR13969.1 hypothetical protein [Candidatus Omnitrophota bacterium]